jgi:D-glycero-D-manno-heptose 1,7-bisphosphate phosphatase
VGIERQRRAVFLDRDGVIIRAFERNGVPSPPATLSEVEILPGVAASLQRLRAEGFLLVVVTNQPDVARGKQSRVEVERMHQLLAGQLPIDEFRVCYHDDGDRCHCRKPLPGMLLDSAAANALALEQSVMVGDRWRDIEAGRRAGCATVFVDHHYSEQQPRDPDKVVASLAEATDWILDRPIAEM